MDRQILHKTWELKLGYSFSHFFLSLFLSFRTKFITYNAAGYDALDIEACDTRGILVSNTPSAVDAVSFLPYVFFFLKDKKKV